VQRVIREVLQLIPGFYVSEKHFVIASNCTHCNQCYRSLSESQRQLHWLINTVSMFRNTLIKHLKPILQESVVAHIAYHHFHSSMPSILQFHHRRVLETPKSHFPKYFEPPDSINRQFKDRDKYDKTQSYTLPHQT